MPYGPLRAMAKEISSSDLVPFHFPLRYMALVTKVKSPDEATAWTRALIFGVPTEYGRKRSSQSARWLKYREDITLNNLTTAAFQSALVRTYVYVFVCLYACWILRII